MPEIGAKGQSGVYKCEPNGIIVEIDTIVKY
jgi:hypothetical protein